MTIIAEEWGLELEEEEEGGGVDLDSYEKGSASTEMECDCVVGGEVLVTRLSRLEGLKVDELVEDRVAIGCD